MRELTGGIGLSWLIKLLFRRTSEWTLNLQTGAEETAPTSGAPIPTEWIERATQIGQYGVALLVLLGIGYVIYKMLNAGPKLKGDVSREALKDIKKRLKEDDFLGAGEIAYRVGAYEDAADFYIQAKDMLRAAEAYNKAGQRKEAIMYFKRAGHHARAAELLENSGQYRLAANEFLHAGDSHRAAKLFHKGKDYRRAADLYAEMEQWREAGEAYERMNLREETAQAYQRYFQQELQLVRGQAKKLQREPREKARTAASIYHQQGEHDKAAKLLTEAGFIMDAAGLLTKLGRVEEAASLYVNAKKPEEAAKLYAAQGDHVKAALYQGEAALMQGRNGEAAGFFAKAGEHMRAGDLLVEVGEHAQAAKMYEAARDFRYAGEQYAAAGDIAEAARCYEESGDYHRAGDCYHRLGDVDGQIRALQRLRSFFRLGKLLMEHGRNNEALTELQKVERVDPNFAEANELQGDIMLKKGKVDVAFNKFKLATSEEEPNSDNVGVFYKMATCLEQVEQLEAAARLYERVLSVDYYYKDAQGRFDAIQDDLHGQFGGQPLPSKSMSRIRRPSSNGSRIAISSASRISTSRRRTRTTQPLVETGDMRYEIIDEIARGGMGIVFRARDTVLNRVVAFKILSENLKNNPTAVKYFLREARAAASLSHQNIVTVYDAGEQDDEYYMAMELVHGETLKSLVTRSGPFHEKLIRFILVHTCRGLAYAHSQGIVHRDIKSGNMMLTRDKTLKLMDFGLAKFIEEYQSQHTKAIGTPFYMSPEQILGKGLDHRSDLYSLGVTLFECATGTVPFYKGELSYHHLHSEPSSPRSLNPNLSETLDEIILKLLQKDPNNRFQSANDVLKALKSN